MVITILGLAVLAVLLMTVLPVLFPRRADRTTEAHRLWAAASANTSDGVTARTEVEFVVHLSGPAGPVSDAVEDLLRREISSAPAHSLPSIGDDPPVLAGATAAGVRIESAVVTSSEVEVTPELRSMLRRTTHVAG